MDSGTTVAVCPKCSSRLTADSRFVQWCEDCDWNLDPTPVKPKGRWNRRVEEQSDRLARSLFESVRNHRGPARRGLLLRAVVLVLAGTVHLVTVALVGGAVWLLVVGAIPLWVRIVGAVLILGLAYSVQPFPLRRRKDRRLTLGRDDAPELFGLLDEVAASVKAPRVDKVLVTADFNAFYTTVGRRRAIGIGMTLWCTLAGQQKVALLGHELGHSVNGDLRNLRFVGRALITLARWQQLLAPPRAQGSSRSRTGTQSLISLAERILLPIVLIPIVVMIGAFGRTLRMLAYRQGQRCEYYADELAARAGGSKAAVEVTETLLIGDVCLLTLSQAVRYSRDPDPWQRVRSASKTIADTEWERRRRLARRRLNRIDSSHPPTQLRADLLQSGTAQDPSVILSTEREERIDKELSSANNALVHQVQDALGVTKR